MADNCTNKAACELFCCSSFMNYQDAALTIPLYLGNNIHPIFAQDRFENVVDYAAIEHSLRLATHFLGLADVARLIVTMADGEVRRDTPTKLAIPTTFAEIDTLDPYDVNGIGRTHISRQGDPQKSKAAVHRRANRLLDQAAPLIRIVFNVGKNANIGAGIFPFDELIPDSHTAFFPRGRRSEIRIRGHYYNVLKAHHDKVLLSQPIEISEHTTYLLASYNLSILLVHEVAHTLDSLFTGHRNPEPFINDNTLAERGFDMESTIFGGYLINDTWSNQLLNSRLKEFCRVPIHIKQPEQVMIAYKYPSLIQAAMYKQPGLKMGCRKVPGKSHPLKEWSDSIYRVPITFIEALFTNAFWNQVRRSNVDTLGTLVEAEIKGEWVARWNSSAMQVQPWLSIKEAEGGKAANSPTGTDPKA